ncbi:MAG: amino acid adenylation domain-containing protein [Elusimicrobiota bacterium]|jgi:amino acid adenylation domain-containing protein
MGTLAGCLTESLRRHPDRPAVAWQGRVLTYAELHAQAEALAGELLRSGVRPGDRVVLYLERSGPAVAAVHGCLMLGAVYVPVDPRNPWPRLQALLDDCKAAALVTEARLVPRKTKPSFGVRLILLDRAPRRSRTCLSSRRAKGSDPAYVLYTSGSTGGPKGVLMADRNAMAFVEWAEREFLLETGDRVANLAPFQFDLSVFDIFNTCCAGACLRIIPYPDSLFAGRIARFLIREKITVFYTVPSVLLSVAALGSVRPGAFGRPAGPAAPGGGRTSSPCAFPDLRLLLFAGEVMPPRALSAWMTLAPNAVFYNLYGPTETNVCMSYQVPRPSPAGGAAIPIGRPLPGTAVRVVDEDGRGCGAGRKGELWIKGPTVMRGYATGKGGLGKDGYYRTGDIVSLEKDGAYRFWGRRDDQVKVRGCRVDLKEVEAALSGLAGVKACAVSAVGDGEARTLAAHVEPLSGRRVCEKGLLEALSGLLPPYMVPTRIVFRKALPRLATGKIDRRGLAESLKPDLPVAAVRRVLEEKVLRGRTLRDDESFWASGALDSLDLLQFVHGLEQAFSIRIPEKDVTPEVFASLESVSCYLAKKVQ